MLDFITNEWRLNKKYTQINGEKSLTQMARQYATWCGDFICISSNQKHATTSINKSTPMVSAMGMGGGHVPMILQIPEATKKGYAEINPGDCVDLENPKSKTRKGRKMSEKSNCMMSAANHFYKYTEDFRLRRLTPIECERLQTVPDNYTSCVSDTQRYKMLGNGWTIKVIEHILSFK